MNYALEISKILNLNMLKGKVKLLINEWENIRHV